MYVKAKLCDSMVGSDQIRKTFFFSYEFTVLFIEMISNICWCADHGHASLFQHFVYALCRLLWGAALVAVIFPVGRKARQLAFSFTALGQSCQISCSFLWMASELFHCKLPLQWAICGPGCLSCCDAAGKLIGLKRWRKVDTMLSF